MPFNFKVYILVTLLKIYCQQKRGVFKTSELQDYETGYTVVPAAGTYLYQERTGVKGVLWIRIGFSADLDPAF
jgi:hypothetical protein